MYFLVLPLLQPDIFAALEVRVSAIISVIAAVFVVDVVVVINAVVVVVGVSVIPFIFSQRVNEEKKSDVEHRQQKDGCVGDQKPDSSTSAQWPNSTRHCFCGSK